ncbi:hypothetical protein ACFPIF_19170 [Brevundimonas faecalis]|uniref:hypothetical protein n=1 Tax=Brevundimonas faecalis TaxID=947378 RepID=UPI00361A4899
MQQLETPVQIGLTALLVVVAVLALWRGGRLERLAMMAVIIATLVTPLVQNTADLHAPQWSIMAVDAALFLFLAALAWRYSPAWLLWAAAFQLITVATHVGYALNLDIVSRAYLSTSYLLFTGLLAAISWGVIQHESRRRKSRQAG